ncbi:hypothetical protein, conserved [Eimeria tenella]|uniref:Transmembrane protein n=1 Tax=Eimeria tenella TaxID=5802 RepID=U6KMC2_EIMTE|nr:hypothetical protein, conserved [Eimeria tenella]CDJ37956.1 hypothetical protein, conserved [Eimeria tenella]|eukprot:XP_013228794.1 hypothetical protein, conserved [Eimeria tenella]
MAGSFPVPSPMLRERHSESPGARYETSPDNNKPQGPAQGEAFKRDSVSLFRHRSRKRNRRLYFSLAAQVAVALLAVAYVVLRCSIQIGSRNGISAVHRSLSSAESGDEDFQGACGGADAPSIPTDSLFPTPSPQRSLIMRGERYAGNLTEFVKQMSRVGVGIHPDDRRNLLSTTLGLVVVELGALVSLMGPRFPAVGVTVSRVNNTVQDLRATLGPEDISHTTLRHFRRMHTLLKCLRRLKATSEGMSEAEIFLRFEQLLELQETALTQMWLGLKNLAVCYSDSGPDHPGIPSAVDAIKKTVMARKAHVLREPLYRAWMMEFHGEKWHFGITTYRNIQRFIAEGPRSHEETMEDLQSTELGALHAREAAVWRVQEALQVPETVTGDQSGAQDSDKETAASSEVAVPSRDWTTPGGSSTRSSPVSEPSGTGRGETRSRESAVSKLQEAFDLSLLVSGEELDTGDSSEQFYEADSPDEFPEVFYTPSSSPTPGHTEDVFGASGVERFAGLLGGPSPSETSAGPALFGPFTTFSSEDHSSFPSTSAGWGAVGSLPAPAPHETGEASASSETPSAFGPPGT